MARATTVRLQNEARAALDRLSNSTGRSRSWLIARALEDFLAIAEWQIPLIEEGIKSANRGDFASDEEMERIWTKFSRPVSAAD